MYDAVVLYFFIALSSILSFVLFLKLRQIKKLKMLSRRADTNYLLDNATFDSIGSNVIFFQECIKGQSNILNIKSKLGHDINGALQILMFTSSRMKKLYSNKELKPLFEKMDNSIKKITDLILKSKEETLKSIKSDPELNIASLVDEIADKFSNAFSSKNINYKIISDNTDSNQRYAHDVVNLFKMIISEIFKDIFVYTFSNLTLPITLVQKNNTVSISMTLNIKHEEKRIIEKYTLLQNVLEGSPIGLKYSVAKSSHFVLQISLESVGQV